jgi:hypothetical protein
MRKLYIKYGIIIAVLLFLYFLLLGMFNLETYTVLSAFNAVIYGAGIYYAIVSYKRAKEKFKFEKGFQVGLYSGFFATILFGIAMAIYMYHIDTSFAEAILEGWKTNYNNGPSVLLISILVMGFSTSFILSFAFMQLLKESWNTKETEKE